MAAKEQSRIQVLNGVLEGEGDGGRSGKVDGSERAPCVATTGNVSEGESSCRGSWEQGQEAVNDHVPEDKTEGDGAGQR